MIRIRSRVAPAAVGALAALVLGAGGAVASQQSMVSRPLPGDPPATASATSAAGAAAEQAPAAPAPRAAPAARDLPGDPVDQPAPAPPTDPSVPPLLRAPSRTIVGYDVSWPQCGERLPADKAFGIVGVTGGLANNTNPCLAEQLAWAETATGGTGQPPVALYVNTANPGHQGSWWPTSDDYAGVTVENPYGTCTGAEDSACAYVYGWAKAYDDTTARGVQSPGAYLWWLDVEWENTWSDDRTANRAVLEGMTTHFESIGASVGLYSTGRQWGQIVGEVPEGSNLYDLPSWLAGARTLSGAKSNCSLPPLTGGGRVTLTQYLTKNLDHNWSCI